MQIFCNRPDGRVALPVFVCTIGQIHVHRNCPVRQSILINFSCKVQVLHTSCPRNFSSFWRFFFQFFIFFRNCFFHLRILDLHFTHQCFLAHVGDSSCTPVLQNIRFFKVDAPLKVQLQRRNHGMRSRFHDNKLSLWHRFQLIHCEKRSADHLERLGFFLTMRYTA